MTSILTPDKLTKEPNSKCAETLQTLKKKFEKFIKDCGQYVPAKLRCLTKNMSSEEARFSDWLNTNYNCNLKQRKVDTRLIYQWHGSAQIRQRIHYLKTRTNKTNLDHHIQQLQPENKAAMNNKLHHKSLRVHHTRHQQSVMPTTISPSCLHVISPPCLRPSVRHVYDQQSVVPTTISPLCLRTSVSRDYDDQSVVPTTISPSCLRPSDRRAYDHQSVVPTTISPSCLQSTVRRVYDHSPSSLRSTVYRVYNQQSVVSTTTVRRVHDQQSIVSTINSPSCLRPQSVESTINSMSCLQSTVRRVCDHSPSFVPGTNSPLCLRPTVCRACDQQSVVLAAHLVKLLAANLISQRAHLATHLANFLAAKHQTQLTHLAVLLATFLSANLLA